MIEHIEAALQRPNFIIQPEPRRTLLAAGGDWDGR